MTRVRLSGLLVLAFVFLRAAPSRAQDVAMYVQMPDSVVVTATRQAADARLTGRRVTVWTRQDIRDLPVTSFDELLRAVGGVDVRSRGGFGVQSDLRLRGSTFNGVLVLLDGARLNDPMTGHFLADFPVPLSEIARIEVLRGPATALYGPDALGGVIQIFTDTGLRERMADTGLGGTATIQYGRNDLYDVDAAGRYVGGRTAASAAVAAQGSNGERLSNDEGQPVLRAGTPMRTDFGRQAVTSALARRLGSATLYTRVGIDDRDFSAYHFYTPYSSDKAREATSTYWGQARLQSTPSTGMQWTAQVAAKQHEDEYVYNPQTPANRHTSRLVTAQAHASYALTPAVTLMGGLSAQVRAIDSNNLGVHNDRAAGAFLASRWRPLSRLTLNASGRVDYDPGYGTEVTPQVHLAYNTDHLTLRGGAGRAVRAPNYVERYYNTTLAQPRGRSLGNPDLDAEQAWSYEAGLDVYPGAGLSLHATAFLRNTDDLIDYAKLAPSDTVFLARNLHHVEARGIELEAAFDRQIGGARLRVATSYTGLDADLGTVSEGVQFKYALTNARHLLQGMASLTIGRATFGVRGLWKEKLKDTAWADKSYGVAHARVDYQLDAFGTRTVLSTEVRNLFDTAYADVFDAPMPGRWWLLGARVQL